MAVFLDIDADFMFRPRTSGNTLTKQELWASPDDLLKDLKAAGLKWKGSPLALFSDHKEAYFVWKEWGAHLDTLVHVDAHSDMYDTFSWCLHCGNYLRRALAERMFSKVIWVMPDWLLGSGDWARWDIPFVTVRRSDSRLGNERGTVSTREERDQNDIDGPPGKIWQRYNGRGCRPDLSSVDGVATVSIKHGKVEFSVVSMEDFKMPNTRVVLVTLATSPMFVPASGLGAVRELVERVARDASCVEVRPNIPLSLKEPRLRELLKVDFARASSPGLFRERETWTSGRWRTALGFLWVEHRMMAEAFLDSPCSDAYTTSDAPR